MIFTERTITVVNDSATINKPLILYRGDKNIELKITIVESQFKFRSTGASNVIETSNASYAQLVINTPYDLPIFSEVTATENGTVIFVISAAMIDEVREVGIYDIQIRLLDDNKQSRASIPPVSNAIEIREPIAIEDGSAVDSNAVNVAKVNRALTTTSAPLEAFDSQGNYIKNIWGDGVLITDAALNKMEAGIDGVNKKVANNSSQIKDIVEQVENLGTGSMTISAWKDKKATFYGDSLTEENFQYTKGYHKWIQEILGLTSYENFGVSGYKISDVYDKVNSTTATGDIIFVMCGVNDENFSTPLGTIEDTTTSTIYGSYNKLCSLLKTKYPTKIILFITPHYQTKYPHNEGITSYEVSKAMKEVCEKYAINVYDNYAISGIYPQNNTNKTTFTTDGCHWNDLGHEIVGKNLANYVLNTYRYVYTGSTSEITIYTITNSLSNSISSNNNSSIAKGSSYSATITPNDGYNISSINITMGGVDVTNTVVSGNTISISNVTGNIVITVTTTVISTTTKYTITNTLNNCTNSNTNITIDENSSYSATITPNDGYKITSIVVTMGGVDVTSSVVSENIITILNVTGNIVITTTVIALNEVVIFASDKTLQNGYYYNGTLENSNQHCCTEKINVPPSTNIRCRSNLQIGVALFDTNETYIKNIFAYEGIGAGQDIFSDFSFITPENCGSLILNVWGTTDSEYPSKCFVKYYTES